MGETWVRRVEQSKTLNSKNKRSWNALDGSCKHPSFLDGTIEQEAEQSSKTLQYSEEFITIIDSCDVAVSSTETQAAISLQVALQVAIALVLSISIADNSKADQIAQELFQKTSVKQINRQHTYIENSRNVNVTTTDTDLAVNIQVLLQVLVALLVRLDVL